MRLPALAVLLVMLLAACRSGALVDPSGAPAWPRPTTGAEVVAQGGVAPGSAEGPGGFVPRGAARSFYAGAGGRLWYYLNHYYWAPPAWAGSDVWIKAEVMEQFRDLVRGPARSPAPPSEPKVTIEYWRIGPGGRSVRLDNHKDYLLLDSGYTEGAIEVRATLSLGRVVVADERGRWGPPEEAYVLEHRNYNDDRGIGPARTRFEPLPGAPVTAWAYHVPWTTHPSRLTRSAWLDLRVPQWRLLATWTPAAGPGPDVTPGEVRGPVAEAGR